MRFYKNGKYVLVSESTGNAYIDNKLFMEFVSFEEAIEWFETHGYSRL